jgi:hypothetical protein
MIFSENRLPLFRIMLWRAPRTVRIRNWGRRRMAKPVLGLEQAVSLVGRMKAAAEGNGRFSDIVMPNGQKLRDCTFGYVAEISEAMQTMGYVMPEDSFRRA